MPWWMAAAKFICEIGLIKGLFAVFFLMMHGWVFILYEGRLKDRQREIERLADDNREYRERYLRQLDEFFEYKSKAKGGKG